MSKKPTTMADIRRAVADFMWTGNDEEKTVLAKLLRVPKYRDGSGWDFQRFRTDEQKRLTRRGEKPKQNP